MTKNLSIGVNMDEFLRLSRKLRQRPILDLKDSKERIFLQISDLNIEIVNEG